MIFKNTFEVNMLLGVVGQRSKLKGRWAKHLTWIIHQDIFL